MSVSQAVAKATTNHENNHFLAVKSTYLLHFLELRLVKYFQTQQSSENDFKE